MFKKVKKHTSRIGLHKVKILITIKLKELILPKESIEEIIGNKLYISFEKDGKQSISDDIIIQSNENQKKYNYNTIHLNNDIELALTLYKNPTTNEFQHKEAKVILRRAIKHSAFVSSLMKEKIIGIYIINVHEFATMMGYEKSLNKEFIMNLNPYSPASKGVAISSEICLKVIHSQVVDEDNMSAYSYMSDSSYASITNDNTSRIGISHIKSFHTTTDPLDLSTYEQQYSNIHINDINKQEEDKEDFEDDINNNNISSNDNNNNTSENEYDPSADIEENVISSHHNSTSKMPLQLIQDNNNINTTTINSSIQNKTRIKNSWKNNFLFRRNPRSLSLHELSSKTIIEMDKKEFKEYKECSFSTNHQKDDESSSNSDRARKNKEAFQLYHKELRNRAQRITRLEKQNSLTIEKYQLQITELRSELNQKDTALKKERIARSTIAKVTDKGDQVLASVVAESREQVQLISIQLDNTKAKLASSIDEINHYKEIISELYKEKEEQLNNSEEVASIVANANLKIMEIEEENDELVKALIDVKIDNANIHMELDQEKRINHSLKKTIKEYNNTIQQLRNNTNSLKTSQEEKRSMSQEYRNKGAIPYGTGLGI